MAKVIHQICPERPNEIYLVNMMLVSSRLLLDVFFSMACNSIPSLDEGPCIYSEDHLPCQIELEAIKQDTRLKIPYLSRLGL